MSHRYSKTPAGRREAQTHARGLSRARRNLLLVINDSQSVDYWLSNLKGVTQDDVAWLEAQGLIDQVSTSEVGRQDDATWKPLLRAIETAPFVRLSKVLKAQAWAQLKGLRAYRFAQDVDMCADETELRDLARAFVGGLAGEFGHRGLQSFHDALQLHPTEESRPSLDSLPSPAPAPTDSIAWPPVPTVPVGFDASECYRLARWPSTSQMNRPNFARLASLISQHALPLQQVALRGRVDVAVALAFLQAMQQHGVLRIERQACPPGVVSPTAQRPSNEGHPGMMAPIQPDRASASPAVSSGLLGRLRERLGLR